MECKSRGVFLRSEKYGALEREGGPLRAERTDPKTKLLWRGARPPPPGNEVTGCEASQVDIKHGKALINLRVRRMGKYELAL